MSVCVCVCVCVCVWIVCVDVHRLQALKEGGVCVSVCGLCVCRGVCVCGGCPERGGERGREKN